MFDESQSSYEAKGAFLPFKRFHYVEWWVMYRKCWSSTNPYFLFLNPFPFTRLTNQYITPKSIWLSDCQTDSDTLFWVLKRKCKEGFVSCVWIGSHLRKLRQEANMPASVFFFSRSCFWVIFYYYKYFLLLKYYIIFILYNKFINIFNIISFY